VSFLTMWGTFWASHFSNASRCSAVGRTRFGIMRFEVLTPFFREEDVGHTGQSANRPKFPRQSRPHHICEAPTKKGHPSMKKGEEGSKF